MARYRRLCHLVGLLLLSCAATALKCPDRSGTPGREIVCYTSSGDVERLENAICRCTTLVHQGHDLQSLDASELKSLRNSAKKANPELRVILSINDNHELLKSSATTRQEATEHLVDVIKEVDGVELNITLGSKDRLVSFVKGLKEELLNKSLEKMILLALPTKPEDLAKQFELKELSKYVDLFTVATHYLRDNDEAYRSFHPSRLMGLLDMLNTDSLVDLISGMGAPKQKILISAPASGYQFTLKKAEENTPRSSTVEEQPASFDRKKLCDALNEGEWTVERDEDLTAPYAFKNTSWIAFEDETSLKIKGKYVILRELAGLALRDVENDSKNDCGASLTQSIHQAFTEMKRKTRDVVLSSLERDLKGSEINYPTHVRSSNFRIVRVVDTAGKIRAVRENTQTAFTCPRQGYFVHPKSCNRFYRCVKFNQEIDDYSVFEFDCPAGLAFDERTEVCVWPGSLSHGSACPGSSEIEPVPRSRFRCPSHPGFYADPQNCRWFFACYDLGGPEMVPYEFRCPFGLVFDEQRLICEWPWKVRSCNGHGHGNDHSVYNYGGSYGGQGFVQDGGIVGQGGFVGQSGFAGQNIGIGGVSTYGNKDEQGSYGNDAYDAQNLYAGGGIQHGAGFNGQTFNAGGVSGSGAGFNSQTFNAGGASGSGVGTYGGQNINAGKTSGTGIGFNGQTYNTGVVGAGLGYDGQTYNTGVATGVEADYGGQTYNAGGVVAGNSGQNFNTGGVAGVDYNDQNFNSGVTSGADSEGKTYNANGASGADYEGKTYNSNGASGADYEGKTYNANGASGADYDGQNYNANGASVTGVGYNGQSFNTGGSVNTGISAEGQTYNANGASGAEADYDGQNYNANGASVTGVGYNGQSFNTGGSVNTGISAEGQTYNANGASGAEADYDGQNYNANGASAAGVGYNGQSFNTGGSVNTGISAEGQTYNSNDASGAEADYDGQSYNANGASAAGVGYNGQSFNTGGSVNTGISAEGQTYNTNDASEAEADYDGQSYNANGASAAGVGYNGQSFNTGGSINTGINAEGQTYNGVSSAGSGTDYDEQSYNAGSNAGEGADNSQTYNGASSSENGGQNFNSGAVSSGEASGGIGGEVYSGSDNADCNNQNFNGDEVQKTINNANDYDGQTVNNANDYDGQTINNANDYDDRGGATPIVTYNGQTGGVKTTQYNSGDSSTTVDVNNFAGNTRDSTGFTTAPVNYAGGATATTAGVTNFGGNIDTSREVTSQNSYTANGKFGTDFAGTTGFGNSEIIKSVQTQDVNLNTFGTTPQTGLYNGVNNAISTGNSQANIGLSTISYGNTANGQSDTNLYGIGDTQYTGGVGMTVYNSSYSGASGYPTSTIIPFSGKQNTYNTAEYGKTTPVNSVIYHSNIAMGLSTTENLGKQYTNQAGKSFTSPVQTPTGFAFNGQTQTYNTATNIYDNSKVNLAGVTPSITLVRDGVYNTGGSTVENSQTANFAGSTITAGVTNANENSQIIGSSVTSTSNDITKFRDTTGSPDNFQFNGNTVGSTGFRTDSSTGTYNQETSINQNAQNYNTQGTSVPGVVPLNNNVRPAVELDNSGIFETNFVSSTVSPTTPGTISTGYRTNEYYDNGGRGTIRYNNGVVANKVAETDIQDYRTPSYTGIPNSFIINPSPGENPQSTIQKADGTVTDGTFTRGGFTKTGPTKTGITTAQVGGSGSYVIGTGTPRARPNPQYIGPNAFALNIGGETSENFNTGGSTTSFGATGNTANFGETGNNVNAGVTGSFGSTGNFGNTLQTSGFTGTDFSKINTVSNTQTVGYSYPKPLVQLEVNGVSSTPGVTQTNFIDVTTPSSVSNVQTLKSENSVIVKFNEQNNQPTSTVSPVAYTTNQLDNFRTTVYQSTKRPQFVTTVRPIIDTGYKTVVSSTPVPAVVSTVSQRYETDGVTSGPNTYLDVGVNFDSDYFSSAQGSTGSSDYSDVVSNVNQGSFGQRVTGGTRNTNINYQQPSTISEEVNENSQLIKTDQENYNSFSQTASENAAQVKSTRLNQNGIGFRGTVPKQVYIPSSTIAPSIGATFGKPIIAAEFSQSQIDHTSTTGISQNKNSDFTYHPGQGPCISKNCNRILNNQAFANFAPQKTSSGILTNQASAGFNTQTLGNQFSNNQAAEFGLRGFNNRIVTNDGYANFASQGASNGFVNNVGTSNFGSQLLTTNNQESSGIFNNQVSTQFGSRGSANQLLNNQNSANSLSGQNQGFSGQTRTLIGSNVVTSIGGAAINEDIIRQNGVNRESLKIASEFNGAGDLNFGRVQSSTLAPEVTTFSGSYDRTQTRVESNAAFNSGNQNKKVIVKLSDLHPLIIDKLSAECTCKANPFAVFRGSNRPSLPINSQNRGPVDLANYDESDIYVDIDDKENEREIDLVRNIPSNRLIKTSNLRLSSEEDDTIVVTSRGEPSSSTYLPPTTRRPSSSTYLPPTTRRPSSTYLPPVTLSTFIPSSTELPVTPALRRNQARTESRQPLLIRVESDSISRASSRRSGKALFDGKSGSKNDLSEGGESFDRYGPGGLRSNDETLQGNLDCARPGLFRHPKYCNKFYACHWDEWKKRFTLHVFNCPVHLAFDASAGACNYPSKGPACQDNKLLF